MQRRGDKSASDSPRCYPSVVQSCRCLPNALIFGHGIAAWRCSALNVLEARSIRESSQLGLVVDDLMVTFDFVLILDFGLILIREVVLDFKEDLSIMGLKDVDDLTLGLGFSDALPLHDEGALQLIPGAVLLVKLSGAFLVDDLLDSPGQVDAFYFRDTVVGGDVVAHDLAGLEAVLAQGLEPVVVDPYVGHGVIDGPVFRDGLDDGGFQLRADVAATEGQGSDKCIVHEKTREGLGLHHGLGGVGEVDADHLVDLVAHWLGDSCLDHGGGVALEGEIEESQDKCGCKNCLHLGWVS